MLGTSLGFMQTSNPSSACSHHHLSMHWQIPVPPALIPRSLPTVVVCQQHEVPLGCEEVSWSFWVSLGKVTQCRDVVWAGQQGALDSGSTPVWGSAANKQDRLAECSQHHFCHYLFTLPR